MEKKVVKMEKILVKMEEVEKMEKILAILKKILVTILPLSAWSPLALVQDKLTQ